MKIIFTHINKQSSMDDIREYFNRVYNQMKQDPEGRFPASLEEFWRLFFDRKENATAYLKGHCKLDKDYLILHDMETGAERDFPVTYLVLAMFVKELRQDLIPLFNDVFLQENEKSLRQLRDITLRHKRLIRKYERLENKYQKCHEKDIETIAKLEETIKNLEITIGKRDNTISMLLAKVNNNGKVCAASHPWHGININGLKSFIHTIKKSNGTCPRG